MHQTKLKGRYIRPLIYNEKLYNDLSLKLALMNIRMISYISEYLGPIKFVHTMIIIMQTSPVWS